VRRLVLDTHDQSANLTLAIPIVVECALKVPPDVAQSTTQVFLQDQGLALM
jgi:hypothetical protein